jgi:putative ABC transport system substrate-binding protein
MPSRMMQTVTRLAWVVFVTAALSLLANPIDAQQASRSYRIGVLNDAWAANHPAVEGLKSGLRELGFEEGRDVAFDIRFTKGDPERLKVDAQELVMSGVDLIADNASATQAARPTGSVPLFFAGRRSGDSGLVRTVASGEA